LPGYAHIIEMGRWDEDKKPRKRKNLPKLIKKIIYIGFIIVALVILAVFIPRAGLNVELLERGGGNRNH
jgi:hypothetical protein